MSASSANQDLPLANERALVELARHDADAFAQIYRQYVGRVHAFAWRRTGNREAAEDITAATFEAALRALPRFRWGRGGFAPWLFRIASNQIIGHHRREARPRSDRGQRAMATMTGEVAFDSMADLVGGQAWFGGDDEDRVRQAIARLQPRYQRAIGLRYLADLDHEAAAQAMGLAKPAFAVVLSRALKALRREFDRIDPAAAPADDPPPPHRPRPREQEGSQR